MLLSLCWMTCMYVCIHTYTDTIIPHTITYTYIQLHMVYDHIIHFKIFTPLCCYIKWPLFLTLCFMCGIPESADKFLLVISEYSGSQIFLSKVSPHLYGDASCWVFPLYGLDSSICGPYVLWEWQMVIFSWEPPLLPEPGNSHVLHSQQLPWHRRSAGFQKKWSPRYFPHFHISHALVCCHT